MICLSWTQMIGINALVTSTDVYSIAKNKAPVFT